MALSSIDFPQLILADRTAPSLPLFSLITIVIFHLPRFFWSPWVKTTSLFKRWFFLAFNRKLWCPRSAFKYSVVHLYHTRFLHFCIYLALFLKSFSSMLLRFSSYSEIGIPSIIVFQPSLVLFPIHTRLRLFSLIVLYIGPLMRSISPSNWPPHQGARLKLNCHMVFC